MHKPTHTYYPQSAWSKALQDAEREGWRLTIGDVGRAVLFLVLGATIIFLAILASNANT